MGKKGSKHTADAEASADSFVAALSEIGDVGARKMFGGYGIFHEGKMFGIVDPEGRAYLKVDDVLKGRFEKAGSKKHGRMPYYSIPGSVLDDTGEMLEWARDSIRVTKG